MSALKSLVRCVLLTALAAATVAPASGTSLIRQGLEDLVKTNSRIVVGDALEAHSYWNADGTMIMTDVRFVATEVLKGGPGDLDFTITIPGGWIGDQGIVIIGAPELSPGHSYLLFLNEVSLPGAGRALTVGDLSQGAFDLKKTAGGLRAVSQASGHPLMPDSIGRVEPPGGRTGMSYESLVDSIRQIVERKGVRQEVK